jgi:cation diffusion facilitator family transporter
MANPRLAVYGAIGANIAIAVTKFTVASITGSSAMLSEGIHSAVDTGNGVLLLVGMRLSERPATPEHPFGHGKELYFWSLIVAVLIFGLGGGVSFYEGLEHLRHPPRLLDPRWNYFVLGASALFEGSSFAIALRQFERESGTRPFWRALRSSKDPSTYTVLAEDGAALLGLAIAALGIFAAHHWQQPALDGLASAAIGVLLAGVAILLIREARGLLIGEGIRPSTAEEIKRLVRAHPTVQAVSHPLSMYVGRDAALLTLDVQFQPGTPAHEVARTIADIEREVHQRFPPIKHIYIEARSFASAGSESRP